MCGKLGEPFQQAINLNVRSEPGVANECGDSHIDNELLPCFI